MVAGKRSVAVAKSACKEHGRFLTFESRLLDAEKLFERLANPDRARRKAALYRGKVGEAVAQGLRVEHPFIQIKDITEMALAASEAWNPDLRCPHTSHWDWRYLVEGFRSNTYAFRMALWNEEARSDGILSQLHALAIGRTTSHNKTVQIEFLETYPFGNHPFCGEVLSIVERCAGAYGAYLGAARLRLVNPAQALVGYFAGAGFVAEPTQSTLCMVKGIVEEG